MANRANYQNIHRAQGRRVEKAGRMISGFGFNSGFDEDAVFEVNYYLVSKYNF